MKPLLRSNATFAIILTAIVLACIFAHSQPRSHKAIPLILDGGMLDIANSTSGGTLFRPDLGETYTIYCVERLGPHYFNFQFRSKDLENKKLRTIFQLMDSISAAYTFAKWYYTGGDTAYLAPEFKREMYQYRSKIHGWELYFNSYIEFTIDSPEKRPLVYGRDFTVIDKKDQ